MSVINVTSARKQLYKLVQDVQDSHEPVFIAGKTRSAVLVSEEDWNSIEETMYLLSIPGMKESIKEGMAEPIEKCSKELKW
jgi:antitoxin YefM